MKVPSISKSQAGKILENNRRLDAEYRRGFEAGVRYANTKNWAVKEYGQFAEMIYDTQPAKAEEGK